MTSRNTHDIVFRTIEIGVALWFPCVLWNCIRPEKLWCLNPKKILDKSQFSGKGYGINKEDKKVKNSGENANSEDSRDSRETSTDLSTTDEGKVQLLQEK